VFCYAAFRYLVDLYENCGQEVGQDSHAIEQSKLRPIRSSLNREEVLWLLSTMYTPQPQDFSRGRDGILRGPFHFPLTFTFCRGQEQALGQRA
jgi:hypothetical protein